MASSDPYYFLISFKNGSYTCLKSRYIDVKNHNKLYKLVKMEKKVSVKVKTPNFFFYGIAILTEKNFEDLKQSPLYEGIQHQVKSISEVNRDNNGYTLAEIMGFQFKRFFDEYETETELSDEEIQPRRKKRKTSGAATDKKQDESKFVANTEDTDKFAELIEKQVATRYMAHDKFSKIQADLKKKAQQFGPSLDDFIGEIEVEKLEDMGARQVLYFGLKLSFSAFIYADMCIKLLKTQPGGYYFNIQPSYRVVGDLLIIGDTWPVEFSIVTKQAAENKNFLEFFRNLMYLSCTHAELKNASSTGISKKGNKELVKVDENKMSKIYDTSSDIWAICREQDLSDESLRAAKAQRSADYQKIIRETLAYNRETKKHTEAELNLREKYKDFPIFYPRYNIQNVLDNPPFWMKVYTEKKKLIDLMIGASDSCRKYASYMQYYMADTSEELQGDFLLSEQDEENTNEEEPGSTDKAIPSSSNTTSIDKESVPNISSIPILEDESSVGSLVDSAKNSQDPKSSKNKAASSNKKPNPRNSTQTIRTSNRNKSK
ncbi:uncharacterized protein LOC112539435 [Tetranychus urticae]|uniref:Uncharacterized protein n=1 Tax=Tetranychus urticae TaxID=32264 RepID=T1KHL8_TETUR|nr:uncharacterized protein LOC112539037 [Tetranychus urticae]XP_025017713.1 uncharacterized protein LOC112539435 [Tetranychus urticae]